MLQREDFSFVFFIADKEIIWYVVLKWTVLLEIDNRDNKSDINVKTL